MDIGSSLRSVHQMSGELHGKAAFAGWSGTWIEGDPERVAVAGSAAPVSGMRGRSIC